MPAKKGGRLKEAVAKATEGLKKRASNAGKALKESKHRRTMEAIEVVGGAVASGAVHGAGIDPLPPPRGRGVWSEGR